MGAFKTFSKTLGCSKLKITFDIFSINPPFLMKLAFYNLELKGIQFNKLETFTP